MGFYVTADEVPGKGTEVQTWASPEIMTVPLLPACVDERGTRRSA